MGGKTSSSSKSSPSLLPSSGDGGDNSSSISGKAFAGLGNLIKLLPTGTVFLFQFVNPVLTDSGHCSSVVHKYLAAALLAVCAFNCCFSTFTDSYTGTDGVRHYGVVTPTGIWPAEAAPADLAEYRLRIGDFVHALLSLMVFAVIGFLDTNTVNCLYPQFESAQKILLQVLPPIIGAVSGTVFMVFPNKRHGIGYPATSDQVSKSSSSSHKP